MAIETMADVIQRVAVVRTKSGTYHEDLAKRFGVPMGDPPIGGFGICYNTATLTQELLTFYDDIWKRMDPRAVPDVAKARQDNTERVVLVTKALYVLGLSGLEYSAKNALPLRSKKLSLRGSRIYLGSIMGASKEAGVISGATYDLWSRAIELRNTLVHNNGIADRTASYQFPDVKVDLQQGQMAKNGLVFFAALTDWTIDSFRDWCHAFLSL